MNQAHLIDYILKVLKAYKVPYIDACTEEQVGDCICDGEGTDTNTTYTFRDNGDGTVTIQDSDGSPAVILDICAMQEAGCPIEIPQITCVVNEDGSRTYTYGETIEFDEYCRFATTLPGPIGGYQDNTPVSLEITSISLYNLQNTQNVSIIIANDLNIDTVGLQEAADAIAAYLTNQGFVFNYVNLSAEMEAGNNRYRVKCYIDGTDEIGGPTIQIGMLYSYLDNGTPATSTSNGLLISNTGTSSCNPVPLEFSVEVSSNNCNTWTTFICNNPGIQVLATLAENPTENDQLDYFFHINEPMDVDSVTFIGLVTGSATDLLAGDPLTSTTGVQVRTNLQLPSGTKWLEVVDTNGCIFREYLTFSASDFLP